MRDYEAGLYQYLDENAQGSKAMDAIRETGLLSDETKYNLEEALKAYTEQVKANLAQDTKKAG